MADFLLELFSEEIPARMQADAANNLGKLLTEQFKAAGINHDAPVLYYGARRLTAWVKGLPVATEAVSEERRGPRVDAPEKAIQGFLRGNGLDSLDQCVKRETPKGEFWFVVIETPAKQTAEMLPGIIQHTVAHLPWPKSMRWGTGTARWVRPLQAILALFDGQGVPGAVDLGNGQSLPFGTVTYGHRFHAPDAITVTDPAQYVEQLRAAKVLADPAERRTAIKDALDAAAKAEGLTVKDDPGLLTEVMGLVELPVPLVGTIDSDFMGLPPEVLITSMRSHQKYFALQNPDGSMAAKFGVVANMETGDGGTKIVAGNERVLRARLSDAKFFWDQDRKLPLEGYLPQLDAITFHEKLGTVAERVERLEALSKDIARMLDADVDQAARAAKLAKADLVTGMVGEFPELQGLMGRYYAQAANESQAIADAIADHYKPAGQSDAVPTAPVSIAVALAEKLDTLVGFFGINEKPTGSRDPYALRRAALGVIRIVLENDLRLSLKELLAAAYVRYEDQSNKLQADGGIAELPAFFADRLKVVLREKGVRHDLIDAVFAEGGGDDLVRLVARVEALQELLGSDTGANLLAAYRRGANIVRKEREKGGLNGEKPQEGLLQEDAEKGLFTALAQVDADVSALLDKDDFSGAMRAFAELRQPVDRFFDDVMVNVDDAALRANRLALLEACSSAYHQIADFSKIEG
ncbi:MAG: glycine--tRNA ligase subunit beta [Pseudomonadota bacterium]